MDEKIVGYLINNSVATHKCLDGVETVMNALLKQAKINKRQRGINAFLGGCVVACLCNISELLKVIKVQNVKINELEEKLNGGKKQKGE